MPRFSERYFRPYLSSGLPIRQFIRDRLGITPRVRWLFRKIAKLPPGALVLDVGCGTGGFIELMERSNPSIHTLGIDLGQPPEYLAKGEFLRGLADQLPFPDNSFDLVTCAHVLEHVYDPERCVREFLRVCRPGGNIYIETPSPRSAWMPFLATFWDDPTHVRPYSQVGLRRILEVAGGEQLVSGVKKSLPAVLFGLPYFPIGLMTGDRQAKAMFAIYAFGFSVWSGAVKPSE